MRQLLRLFNTKQREVWDEWKKEHVKGPNDPTPRYFLKAVCTRGNTYTVVNHRQEVEATMSDEKDDSELDREWEEFKYPSGKEPKKVFTRSNKRAAKLNTLGTPGQENFAKCPWEMSVDEYACAEPGSIGFNGHQAVFHCYKPGQAYLPRGACTDKCTLKLSTLGDGTQLCSIVYDKPPVPTCVKPRRICTTERLINTDLQIPIASASPPSTPSPPPTPPEKAKGKADKGKDKKGGKGGGKKGKGKKK